MKHALSTAIAAALSIIALQATPAEAQTRVFVAAQGSDSNPCTLSQPCRSFQKAHETVAANGEINVLDPAGYGAVTITKAISIQGHGFAGFDVTAGADAITINAGPSDKINLRGLLLDGVALGRNGITFNTGASLNIQDCLVRNFTRAGIHFKPSALSNLYVSNTLTLDSTIGVAVESSGSATATVTLSHVELDNNVYGLYVFSQGPVNVTLSDSVVAHNNGAGVEVIPEDRSPNVVMVRNSTIANSPSGIGVHSATEFNNAIVRITKSTITGNNVSAQVYASGQIFSYGDNNIDGNNTNALPVTIPLH